MPVAYMRAPSSAPKRPAPIASVDLGQEISVSLAWQRDSVLPSCVASDGSASGPPHEGEAASCCCDSVLASAAIDDAFPDAEQEASVMEQRRSHVVRRMRRF